MIYERLALVSLKWFIGDVGNGFNEHSVPLSNHGSLTHTVVVSDLSPGSPSEVIVSIKRPLQRPLMAFCTRYYSCLLYTANKAVIR